MPSRIGGQQEGGGEHGRDDGSGGGEITDIGGLTFVLRSASVTYIKDNT